MATWWDEWELRILVLASLAAQYCLLLFAVIRKFHIPPWLRSSFRLAQIASDTLALLALATLFQRQRSGPSCSGAPATASLDLEQIWAPILLMHLGGQVLITSYRIEDNEKWIQYIMTSLSKVTVALYLFHKTWSSDDKRLLTVMVLLYTLVIIKCFYKTLHLKRSSFNAMREVNSPMVKVGIREDGQVEQLFHFIEKAKKAMDCSEPQPTVTTPSPPDLLFMDFPYSYSDRLKMVRNFWSLDHGSAFRAIERALSVMTSILYTKDGAEILNQQDIKDVPFRDWFYGGWETLSVYMIGIAYLLFQTDRSIETSYRIEDIAVTSLLLLFSKTLEWLHWYIKPKFLHNFSGRIHQHSLIEFFAHTRRHSTLRSIAGWLQCKDFLDGFYRMEPSNSCEEITELVRLHVETGWGYISDPRSYMMFNDTRGEWTLKKNRCVQQLGRSTRRPFDESIVLWHLATDFCIHHRDHTSPDDIVSARWCTEMSNYMVHLLYDNPEMLMPGSRKRLIETVCEELEVLFEGERIPLDKIELTRRVFEKCKSAASLRKDTASLTGEAWALAQVLLSFDENDTRIWDLIIGVWLEMLCYSASRCRGYLHAEALGTEVEYLSYVWVLLVHTGMETFPEKLQRREWHSFDNDESLGSGLARNRGDAVTPSAPTGVEILPEELQKREGHSCDSDESLDHGLARKRDDATPLLSQSEGTLDIVLQP